MKYLLIYSILLLFLQIGCLWVVNKTAVRGSGIVTKVQRTVSLFDKIEIAGAFSVYLQAMQ